MHNFNNPKPVLLSFNKVRNNNNNTIKYINLLFTSKNGNNIFPINVSLTLTPESLDSRYVKEQILLLVIQCIIIPGTIIACIVNNHSFPTNGTPTIKSTKHKWINLTNINIKELSIILFFITIKQECFLFNIINIID